MPFKVLVISQIDRTSRIADSIVPFLQYVNQQTQDDIFSFAQNTGVYLKDVFDNLKSHIREIGIVS